MGKCGLYRIQSRRGLVQQRFGISEFGIAVHHFQGCATSCHHGCSNHQTAAPQVVRLSAHLLCFCLGKCTSHLGKSLTSFSKIIPEQAGQLCRIMEGRLPQMLEDVRLSLNGKVPVEFYGRVGGNVPSVEEMYAQVVQRIAALV